MLEIDVDSKYGILFVRLFGELTVKTRKKLNDILDFLMTVGIKKVVFNLENVYRMDISGFKSLIKCYNISSLNNGVSMICINKDKFNFNLKGFNVVEDELKAVSLINV